MWLRPSGQSRGVPTVQSGTCTSHRKSMSECGFLLWLLGGQETRRRGLVCHPYPGLVWKSCPGREESLSWHLLFRWSALVYPPALLFSYSLRSTSVFLPLPELITLNAVRLVCSYVLLGKLVFLSNVLFKSSYIPCHPTGHGKVTYFPQAEKYSMGGLPAILLHLTVVTARTTI